MVSRGYGGILPFGDDIEETLTGFLGRLMGRVRGVAQRGRAQQAEHSWRRRGHIRLARLGEVSVLLRRDSS